jgi:predicted Fe-S protein YdhL (DUF1289 family)
VTDDLWRRAAADSPCIRLCVVHPEARLSMGCYRSIDEIAAWTRMTPEARRAVLADLPSRAPRVAPVRRGGREGHRAQSGDPDA